MIVVVDIDDVIVPWAQTVHDACVAAGLNPEGREWDSWFMWESYGCAKDEWAEVVRSLMVPGGMYHQPPYPGAGEALRRLFWEGHTIHLVTSRGMTALPMSEQIKGWTREWVVDFAIPGTLHFAHEKGALAATLGATHGIDDRIDYVEDLIEAGVDAYLMDAPHNRKYPYVTGRRVSTLAEFVDKIIQEDA